jgi:hypothetical protein
MVAPAIPAPMRATNSNSMPQHGRDPEQQVESRRTGQPDDQHGTPADPIGKSPPKRGKQKLHDRETGHQQPQTPTCRIHGEHIGIDRKQWQDHAEAQQIDENGQEDDQQRASAGFVTHREDTRYSEKSSHRRRCSTCMFGRMGVPTRGRRNPRLFPEVSPHFTPVLPICKDRIVDGSMTSGPSLYVSLSRLTRAALVQNTDRTSTRRHDPGSR